MELADVLVLGEPLHQEVHDDSDDDAEREAEEELLVLSGVAEDLERADGAPKDGGREEGGWAGAEETHRGLVSANILDVDLEL